MDFKKEIIGAIQVITQQTVQKLCPNITFGTVKAVGNKNKCTVTVDGIEQNLTYYGNTTPTINQKYPVFVPFGNMSLGFIITSDSENCGRNLLDNPFFTINQRGATSVGASSYGVDRWKTSSSSSYTVHSGYINCACSTSNSIIAQTLENWAYLQGKTVTLSAIINGAIRSFTVSFPSTFTSGWSANSAAIDNVYLRFYWNSNLQVQIVSNNAVSNVKIAAVKLEIGSISTIANDTVLDYNIELLKCQKYFQRIGGGATSYHGFGGVSSTANKQLFISVPCVNMRTTPTVSYNGTVRCFSDASTAYEIESITVASKSSAEVTLLVTMATALDGGKVYLLRTDGTAYIDFIADL